MIDKRDPFTRALEARDSQILAEVMAERARARRDKDTQPSCFNCVFRTTCEVSALKNPTVAQWKGAIPPMACGGVGYGYKADPKIVRVREERHTIDTIFGDDGFDNVGS